VRDQVSHPYKTTGRKLMSIKHVNWIGYFVKRIGVFYERMI
jgi:hypothetical protein